ncbi:MAG: acyl-CoA thioesterase, partial [Myxococcales bacterium]|nr:acyl-CoA thioesterase [Myxococcales bacterium]
MITGRLRALRVLAAGALRPSATVSELAFRVLPTDVDLNVHLTNSRYPQMMDLGRMDLLVRSGVGRAMSKASTWPVMVDLDLKFRRELRLGTAYTLQTRVTGQRRKAVIFEQRFLVGERLHAVGHATVVCLHGGKVVAPDVFAGLLDV